MGVPSSKAELSDAVDKTFEELNADLDRVPLELVRKAVLPGHAKNTVISPADLVAYLIGWNQQVLTWHERRVTGQPDEFPASGVKWNELGKLAQRYYTAHKDDTWSQLRTQLTDSKAQIVALIQSCSDDELYGSPWYGKWTMGRMISLNTSSPYANARRRIRSWLRTL
ncbi:ClbS/DfsB family four-helix bundle protein [Mycolicibacterium goodii]|uniref:ClbS/DfsB family four-helix bundle protein n=1 Tax=Mycolicibacterium goodii TaxID=134601 RepID=UPI001BDD48F2|nr:ClbS/DfsB family four-helix bundle protein [Mycolicibacterium goodii]MBU8828740.1 ClbS/DfsB family four-helix bundle protein [Mycolicibacterium goodii]